MRHTCRQRGFRVIQNLALAVLAIVVPRSFAADPGPTDGKSAVHMQRVGPMVDQNLTAWVNTYKELHRKPELSMQEKVTAARLAAAMKDLGYEVHTEVGGYGVVCIFKNGPGPTVMVRTDMDALPVVERTGLPYASKETVRDRAGKEVGAMHACGHDMHMACWLAAAKTLVELKDMWHGNLMFIAQPAEESGSGAALMLDKGQLFTRFPKPDYALALHCDSQLAHGQIAFTEGSATANVDSVDIVVHGRGGHGSAPHLAIDPIVIAARIVLDLQTIVSRENNPIEPCVVTVGSIHGGTKHNIIPPDVRLQITVRTTKDSVRKRTLEAIKRIALAAAAAAGAPAPDVQVDIGEFTPFLHNDPALTRKTIKSLREALGSKNVIEVPPVMGGEDFSRYGKAGVPVCMFWLGTVAPEQFAKRDVAPLPTLHSDLYSPVPEPSLKAGATAMTLAVLNLLGN